MFDNNFFKYFSNKGLGYPKFYKETNRFYYEFTEHDFKIICENESVFNGSNGGLVLGNLHSKGGIHLVSFNPKTNLFTYTSEIEGGEYLSQPLNEHLKDKYDEINNRMPFGFNDDEMKIDIPTNCNVIDTENKENSIVLITEYIHFIVNRLSTKTYINELVELNKIDPYKKENHHTIE